MKENQLMPVNFTGKYEMAKVLSQSGLLPQGLNTPEKVCVALQWGHELGLSPMVAVNNVVVINGKPTLSADIMGAVVKQSEEFGGIEWKELTNKVAECEIKRILKNGTVEKITSRFTIEDAQVAGLTNKAVWKMYPKRMLKHRCLSYGLRDMFPDLLAGLYEPEEMESIAQQEKNITAEVEVITDIEPNSGESILNTDNVEVENQDDNRSTLIHLVNQYEKELSESPQNPTPLILCENAIASGDEDKIKSMLERAKIYLEKKGVEV